MVDSNAQTPAEIAKYVTRKKILFYWYNYKKEYYLDLIAKLLFRMAGHIDLSDRLIECMYEVTDRLTYFICLRKPNHKVDEHIIIPECTLLLEQSDLCLEGRNKLQMVNIYLYI